MNSTVINIVSGKGGTGKTLFSAILADLLGNNGSNVLVIDLDVYVRGLTSLLYFHKGEAINLIEKGELSTCDILYQNKPSHYNDLIGTNQPYPLGIKRYRSFDILPSVDRIDELVDLDDPYLDENKYFSIGLEKIFNLIPKNHYDFIFLDCRAGYDILVSKIHSIADFTICIQEDDFISDITARNLIKQLDRENSKKPIFRVINKARNIHDFKQLNSQLEYSTFIGRIPFDMDVLNSFGEKTFWDDISKSLYKAVVSEIWNNIASKMKLHSKIEFYRYSPVINQKLESKLGILALYERLLLMIGILLATMGFGFSFFKDDILHKFYKSPEQFWGMVIGFFGLFMMLNVYFRKNKKSS
ncbi:MAG: AAA family ATPase [Pedobacter sp.]|uniref:AAA family ATPase n=1 Tax=Pedobacter sp. TaxID=1411316 RepID=UPI002809798C|nr:AAA family ATPase [Pedobacter sp.]MDQ8005273.1 AAA family ATPase [Pedobacter sp.]